MKILRNYLLREHLGPFVVTLLGLTAVLLIGNVVKFAELIIAKGVDPLDLLRLLIYLVPYTLIFTVPMACLVAMNLAFSRLSTDYELIAMRASGIAPLRLVIPILVAGIVISVSLLALNDRVVPESHLAFRRQLKAIGIKQPTAYLEPGTFIKSFVPYVIFIYQIEGQELDNIRIYEPQPNGPTRTIIANRGEFEPLPNKRGVRLKLFDGTADEWDQSDPGSFYKISFSTYTMKLLTDNEDPNRINKKLKEYTFKEMTDEEQRLEAEGIDSLPVQLEYHRRVAWSFASFVFILFGLSLGLRLHHHERLISFVWILSIFVVYYVSAIGMNAIALKEFVPAWVAMWVPNFIGITTGAALLAKTVRR